MVNIEEIPYKDEQFDRVIANMMLYHVPNIQKALSEVNRVLKDGGIFIVLLMEEIVLLKL